MKKQVLAIALLLTLIFPLTTQQAQAVEVASSFITINISGTPNPNDFPFSADCSNNTYFYTTLFSQGALVRIDKTTQATTIFDDNSASSGHDWYSLATDPISGKIFINEKDTGRDLVFDPNTSLFTAFGVVPNISGGVISYVSSYNNAPHNIAIAGSGTHQFGFNSFGELKATNGYIWQVLDATYDFTSAEETAGAVDSSFHGVVRIDPSNNAVTRYAISGASALRGVTVDSSDSTILWLTDNVSDKIFKFNTNTGTVTETITLTSGSNARGISNDATNLYVALNKNTGSTSEILQISKANTALQTTIDTTASRTGLNRGTFTVFVDGSILYWSDQSRHVGSINLSNNVKAVSTTTDTNSNHFGCKVGTQFWFAGQGSAKVGIFESPSGSGGDGCKGDCTSPTIGVDEYGRKMVTNGFTINGKTIDVSNYFTPMELQTLHVGKPNTVGLKIHDDSGAKAVSHVAFCMDIPTDSSVSESNACILWDNSWNGIQTVSTIDKHHIISNPSAIGKIINGLMVVIMDFTVTEPLTPAKFGTIIWDQNRNPENNVFNHGLEVTGESTKGKPYLEVSDETNTYQLYALPHNDGKRIDQFGNVWIMLEDFHWTKLRNGISADDFNEVFIKDPYDRRSNMFYSYVKEQEKLALKIAKSNYGDKYITGQFAEINDIKNGMYPYPDKRDSLELKSSIQKEIIRAELKANKISH